MFTSPAPRLAVFAALLATPAVLLTACTSSGSEAPASSHPPVTSTSSGTGSSPSRPAPSSGTASPTSTSPTSTSPASSSTGATGTAALVQRADAICKTGNVYRRAHPFPYHDFDSADPKVAELPGVATYLKKAPDVAGQLLNLDLPLGVATALTQLRKNSNALVTAAANDDPQTFARAAADRHTVGQRLHTAAKPAGLASATACLSYFNKV